ncbi:MAG TPA: hypothetical protein VHO23_01340 [Candidatus Paceibacterota bacterium]|nr:hypothetical protein [Candidatus Paceibacterota bacterium]
MPVFQAIGLGIAILTLKLLVPAVFSHIESTAIAFLQGAETSASVATGLAASAGTAPVSPLMRVAPPSATPPFPLPTAPLTSSR